MYIWRGKNRRDKRNLLLLGETFWGASKDAADNSHADAQLREELEQKHLDYYAVKVRALMEMYMTNTGGKEEISLLIQQLETADSRIANFVRSDDLNAYKRAEVRANLRDIYTRHSLRGMDLIDEQGLKTLFADLQMTLTKKEFYVYLRKLGIDTKDTAVDFDGFYEVLMEEMIAQQERREEVQRAKAALRSKMQEAAQSLKLALFGDPEKNPKEVMRRRIEQRRKQQSGEAAVEQQQAAESAQRQQEQQQEERRNKANLSYKVQRRLQSNAAKMLLVDHAVHHALQQARQEYRTAHPCEHACEHCGKGFPDRRSLLQHSRDRALHVRLLSQQLADQERFQHVDFVFRGEQGRRLRANRLIFSSELGSLQHRIDAAMPEPFRPSIADVNSRRHKQQLRGSFVQGFDPKAGIRTAHRSSGLLRQHLATQRRAAASNSLIQVSEPRLQDVLHNLLRCKDDFIDTVSTCDNPMNKIFPQQQQHIELQYGESAAEYSALMQSLPAITATAAAAGGGGIQDFHRIRQTDAAGRENHDRSNSHGMCAVVRFQWQQHARSQVQIIGEFTGWQPLQMTCDVRSGIYCRSFQLTPGRYRYRFIMDGEQLVDAVASSVADSSSPIGRSNEILVTNTPLFHLQHKDTKLPMKAGERIDTSMQAASKRHYQAKLGLPLPTAADATSTSVAMGQGEQVYRQLQGFNSPLREQLQQHSMNAADAIEVVDDIAAAARDARKRQHRANVFDLSSPSRSAKSLRNNSSSGIGGIGFTLSNSGDESEDLFSTQQQQQKKDAEGEAVGAITHISRTDKKALMRRLEHINLRNLSLCDDGVWALSSYVSENNFIRVVDLSFNCVSDEGVQALAGCLPLMRALQTLRLNGNGFGYDAARYLCGSSNDSSTATTGSSTGSSGALRCCPQLRCLEMASNRLGDDGFEVLCSFLRYNEQLRELYVDSNLIGNDGMECLHQALLNNRTLQRISLGDNRISTFGIDRLSRALQFNASLQQLSLNNNSLGPEAIKFIGDFVYVSDCIRVLELANVDLLGDSGSSFGLSALCYGIKKNRSLVQLNLRKNALRDAHAVAIAHAMSINESITQLEVDGNLITKQWLLPETFIPTHVLPEMPSLRTSLDKNKRLLRDAPPPAATTTVAAANSHQLQQEQQRVLDDVPHGKWNNRRQWKRETQNREQRALKQQQRSEEHRRIEEEVQFISSTLGSWMHSLRLYMQQPPCQQYIRAVAKCFTQHLRDLPLFDPADFEDNNTNSSNNNNSSGNYNGGSSKRLLPFEDHPQLHSPQSRRSASVKLKQDSAGAAAAAARSSPLRQLSRTFSAASIASNSAINRSSSDSLPQRKLLLPQLSSILQPWRSSQQQQQQKQQPQIHLESFLNTHLAVVNAVFLLLDGGSTSSSLLLPPLRMQQAMQMLALPLPDGEVQAAVDATLVPAVHGVGIHKFSEFVLDNAKRLASSNRFQRLRVLTDLSLHSPTAEAEAAVLSQMQHVFVAELRDKFRALPANRPLFACAQCSKRFATQRQLQRHCRRGDSSKEHRRHKVKAALQHAQSLFLQQVKWSLSGIFFPAYFELLPAAQLPQHYIPQVVDRIGAEGRPLGVLLPRRTVRALDVFGDFLHVLWQGQTGWVRFRGSSSIGSSSGGIAAATAAVGAVQRYLRPVCEGEAGFDWDSLHLQEQLTYYRVNDALSTSVQLKVRHQPTADGDVVGYLQRGQVVECVAVIGDWLQVRFELEDAAWVRWRPAADDPAAAAAAIAAMRASTTATAISSRAAAAAVGTTSPATTKDLTSPPLATSSTTTAAAVGSPLSRSRLRLLTPGEQRAAVDDFFDDSRLTYELDGREVRVNTKKQPQLSRKKIDYFNKVRYGSSEEGTAHATLLLLPRHLQQKLLPQSDPQDSSGQRQQQLSPQLVTQQQLFDAVVSCSERELRGPVQFAADVNSIATEGNSNSRRVHRFGRSEKDEVYGFSDFDDTAELLLQQQQQSDDDDSVERTAAALASLQDYEFPLTRNNSNSNNIGTVKHNNNSHHNNNNNNNNSHHNNSSGGKEKKK